MSQPLSPPPLRTARPEHLPAYVSNGLIGLRCPPVPFLDGTAMVNGFAGIDPNDGVEGFSRVPYPLAADVRIGGILLSQARDQVALVEQAYDFGSAELTTKLRFHVNGVTADIDITTLCSRTQPTIALQEVGVSVDEATDLELTAGIDPTGVPGEPQYLAGTAGRDTSHEPDALLVWQSPGAVSLCGIAYRTELAGMPRAERRQRRHDERGRLATNYRFRARPGKRYVLRQATSLVADLGHPHPADQAARLQAQVAAVGWESVREAHRARWRDLWKARIVIDGASRRWQAITDASLFYLLYSVHPSSIAGTSLFGLAYWPTYHYYRGHVMWDIETFIVPPLVLLAPEAARAILDYRVRHLDGARRHAKIVGWRGAMYPWESCPLHGEEATPGATPPNRDFPSLDIALAFAEFIHATGDRDALRRWAWPVLEAVSDFVVSRVEKTERGYEIRGTIGPAELIDCTVDNCSFVNMAAARTLREAADFARSLGETPPALWDQIAAGLVIPQGRGGHIVNHDNFRIDRRLGETPEGAAGIWPVGYEVSPEVEQATFRFATTEQSPRYAGVPMLSGFLAYYAVAAGLPEQATQLLETGYANFIDEPFLETDEFTRLRPDLPRAAPMFANIGAYVMTLIYGYPGIRIGPGDPASWCQRPVVLPPGWRSIEIERVWARGSAWSLEARRGASAADLVRTTSTEPSPA
jgi:trehalose/maltose hydrolase-like predicted phosphorylase